MSLSRLYKKIIDTSEAIRCERPMLVGGIPRDIYLGRPLKKDIDLTTNSADCPRLGLTVARDLNLNFKMFEDGHVSLYTSVGSFDFSGNFISKKAVEYSEDNYNLKNKELYEVYSRDFTMNTLHRDLFEENLIDLTDLAIKDLDNKVIRTITTPEICFDDDLRRVFRAINFSARLGFSIDGAIIDYAKNNVDLISREMGKTLRDAFITSIIAESISNDSERTLGYLVDMNILSLIPLTGTFKDEIIKRRMVTTYLDGSKK